MKKTPFILVILILTLNSKAQDIKAYQNYDFVAGDQIIFSDDFADSQVGEFGIHWKLMGGQAVVSKIGEDKALFITKYYTGISPRIKQANYLPKDFTVEFDAWLDESYDSNPGVGIVFKNGDEPIINIKTNYSNASFSGPDLNLIGDYPKEIANENYFNKWHHYAIAVKGSQIKIYCDQYRILSVPECVFKAQTIEMKGDASEGKNMSFKDFRLASGGDQNIISKAFTDGKYISHGIHFAVSKTLINPQSMGEINAIFKVLKENPSLKIEIGGHTDSDGDGSFNLKLSEGRAQAVQSLLISMGIETERLIAKGYGKTKPISDNTSTEGKANNRRVEFIKM